MRGGEQGMDSNLSHRMSLASVPGRVEGVVGFCRAWLQCLCGLGCRWCVLVMLAARRG